MNNVLNFIKLEIKKGLEKYDPPHTLEQIKKNYGEDIFTQLSNDPLHKWRASKQIELIHKEPSLNEQLRIWKNWNLMSQKLKTLSDQKSKDLFGISNLENHKKLMKNYLNTKKIRV